MRIICFGDSLTTCGGEGGRYPDILQDRFPEHEFINKGVSGETWVDAKARLKRDVLKLNPDVVLLEFGANDWQRKERPYKRWAKDLETVVRKLKDQGIQVVILGVFGPYLNEVEELVEKTFGIDERARAYRELEQEIAAKYDCPYVNNIQQHNVNHPTHWYDTHHANEYGNRYVADMIEPVLEQILGCTALPIRKPTINILRDIWDEAVALQPNKIAVIADGQRLSYAAANEQVIDYQARLIGLGCAQGSKVAVCLPNCLEFYLLYWATIRMGGVIVPINPLLKPSTVEAILDHVRPKVVIGKHGLSIREFFGSIKYASEVKAEIAPDEPAIIMHTSGTTGRPKGAVMRHQDLLFNVMATIRAHQFRPSDVHLVCNPMFHCTALYSSLPTAAYKKSACVITADTDPHHLLDQVTLHGVTTLLTVPSVLQRICAIDDLEQYDLKTLRLVAFAGSPMPPATIRQLKKRLPDVELHNFFGLTETISMTHVMDDSEILAHPDSIGRLLPFTEACVVDKEDRICAPGEVGELLVERNRVIAGYFNSDTLDDFLHRVDDREWYRTGDLACVDDAGYFYLKGRKKDVIIVGGENVHALELESILTAFPGVADVAVVGVKATGIREALGEMIRAYLVAAPELNLISLKRHCHHELPSYAVPHEWILMDHLPRNPAGKIERQQLLESDNG